MTEHKDAYTFLAEKHGFGSSQSYLRVLQFLMTPQQVEMVTHLPGSPEEVARKAGLKLADVKKNLDVLYRKGVIVLKDYKVPDDYMFCKYAERMWEVSESLMGLDLYSEAETKQLFRLWDDWKETDYADMTAARWHNLKAMGINGLRIVPAYKSILDSPQILPQEDAREIVRVQPLITVVSCSCRKHKRMVGKPCKKSPSDINCLQFAKSAQNIGGRGDGYRR